MNKHVRLELDENSMVKKVLPNNEEIEEMAERDGFSSFSAAFLLGKITGGLFVINDLMQEEEYELAKNNLKDLELYVREGVAKLYYSGEE